MNLREPTAADRDRIGELVESAITTSYRLSPQQIDRITAEEFDEEALAAKIDSEETVVRVAESGDIVAGTTGDGPETGEAASEIDEAGEETTVVGYVEGRIEEPWGELEWLFVDPEHRGKGIGEQLFETASKTLRASGAEKLRGTTLEANAEGQEFFERFGLEPAGDRGVELGEESLVLTVYADPSADVEAAESVQDEETEDETALPGTKTAGGTVTAETADGRQLYLARDEHESGEEGPFFVTYTDADHAERFGYYCSNCGSVDVTMDSVDRIECRECGNAHASRSSESYDGSYL